MIPNQNYNNIISSGDYETTKFEISSKDALSIMTVLQSTIYTNAYDAIIREYCANAWDANRSIGNGNIPIEIHVPSRMHPTLIISDCGPGISHDDICSVYTKYGASTKRDSDQFVGMLGIGSKSAFAYTDSFSVVSYNGGYKSIYVNTLNNGAGSCSLIHKEECGDKTGLEIHVPVKKGDIDKFESSILSILKYFSPLPILLNSTSQLESVFDKYSFADDIFIKSDYYFSLHVLMGPVPYSVNIKDRSILDNIVSLIIDKIYPDYHKKFKSLQASGLGGFPPFSKNWIEDNISKFFHNNKIVIKCNIGDVDIAANRESVSFSTKTYNLIADKIVNYMAKDYKTLSLDLQNVSQFDRLVKIHLISKKSLVIFLVKDFFNEILGTFNIFDVNIPGKENNILNSPYVPAEIYETDIFSIRRKDGKRKNFKFGATSKFNFNVAEDSVIYVKDVNSSTDNFSIPENAIIFSIKREYANFFKSIGKLANKFCKDNNIDGIKLIFFSSLKETKKEEKSKIKKFKYFRLVNDNGKISWCAEENYKNISQAAMHLRLDRCNSTENSNFDLQRSERFLKDWITLAEYYNIKLPDIIGHTFALPNNIKECNDYLRNDFINQLFSNSNFFEDYKVFHFISSIKPISYEIYNFIERLNRFNTLENVKTDSVIYKIRNEIQNNLPKSNWKLFYPFDIISAISGVADRNNFSKENELKISSFNKNIEEAKEKYPIIFKGRNFMEKFVEICTGGCEYTTKDFVDYVNIVDNAKGN